MTESADQETDADHAVQDDHQRRVDRVAGKRRVLTASHDHHRQDERGLDHRDGHGEDESPERLADPVGDHFCVVNGGDDGADERHGAEQGQHEPGSDDECEGEQADRRERDEPRPGRHERF